MSNGNGQPISPPHPVMHPAVQIAQMILNFLTLMLTLYITSQANKNEDKIQEVQQVQKENTARQEEVKQTLEVKATHDAQATEIQMWSTWKYLQSIADESGSPADRNKALEAKKMYDEFRQKNAKR